MGIFSRKDKEIENIGQELRGTEINTVDENNESSTVPIGLDFLVPYLTQGEATAISAFFSGLQLISSTIASTPINVKDKLTGEIVDHEIDKIFDSNIMSKFTLMKNLIWDLYYSGNAVAYIRRLYDGTPKELIYIPSGSYTISYDEFKRKLYYYIPSIGKGKIEPINVVHLVLNSKDGVNGKGIPEFAKKIIKIALATDNHAKNYFENGANIDGILKSNKILSSTQKYDIKSSWNAVHGAGKSGGIAVIGADMEYIPIGSNANDSEMLETREFNAQEICRYLCIDPILIGLKSASSYNSIEQAQLSFLSHCIYPLISMLECEFNRKLIKPSERGTLNVDFDENQIMFSDKAATANYYSTLVKNGIITINEARHYLGLQPKEGADDLIIPFTDVSQNTVGNQEDTEKNNQI